MSRGGGGTALPERDRDRVDAPPPLGPAEREALTQARLYAFAPPIAFAIAFALMASPLGRLLSRIFLSMWVHELGHAVAAWFTGFSALPGPWFTSISDDRRWPITALLVGLLGLAAWRAWLRERRVTVAVGLLAGLAVLALLGPQLPVRRARALFTFGGDAGMLVLGAALAATFFVSPDGYLHRNALRWGFLPIGAVAFADATTTWLAARRDRDAIPFGENEGVGPSDPTVLFDDHGWTIAELVGRHLTVATFAALALAALWAWTVRRAYRALA